MTTKTLSQIKAEAKLIILELDHAEDELKLAHAEEDIMWLTEPNHKRFKPYWKKAKAPRGAPIAIPEARDIKCTDNDPKKCTCISEGIEQGISQKHMQYEHNRRLQFKYVQNLIETRQLQEEMDFNINPYAEEFAHLFSKDVMKQRTAPETAAKDAVVDLVKCGSTQTVEQLMTEHESLTFMYKGKLVLNATTLQGMAAEQGMELCSRADLNKLLTTTFNMVKLPKRIKRNGKLCTVYSIR